MSMADIDLEGNVMVFDNLEPKVEIHNDYYRWHDLRKNPQDLPEEMCVLLVMCKLENGGKFYAISALDGEYWKCTSNTLRPYDLSLYQVDAWKYLEPFKEDKQ